jgi:hypothetical protein
LYGVHVGAIGVTIQQTTVGIEEQEKLVVILGMKPLAQGIVLITHQEVMVHLYGEGGHPAFVLVIAGIIRVKYLGIFNGNHFFWSFLLHTHKFLFLPVMNESRRAGLED